MIPARLATGFQSGVYNSISDLWLVRTSDAHSWVEAWIPGRGWTTFDPTPFDPSGGGSNLLTRLSLLSDTASQFWNDWVMSYDQGHQLALASRMHVAAQRLRLPDFDEVAAGFKRAVEDSLRYLPVLGAIVAMVVLWLLFGPAALKKWKQRVHARKLQRGVSDPSDATLAVGQTTSSGELTHDVKMLWRGCG